MNDKSLECLKAYDMQVKKMIKGRGGVILFTDAGCRLFLECTRNDGFYYRDEAVTNAVCKAGFESVDTYIRNKDGGLFTIGDDGRKYVVKNWFGGRECDVKSVDDVTEAVRTLARLHICLNVVSSKGIKYVRDDAGQNIMRQWECMALAEMEAECQNAELIASESCGQNIYVKFDKGTGIRQNFDRHTKEIKKAANYMRGKKKKNEFEQIALAAIDGFYREALAASELVQSKMFDERLFMEATIIITFFLMLESEVMQLLILRNVTMTVRLWTFISFSGRLWRNTIGILMLHTGLWMNMTVVSRLTILTLRCSLPCLVFQRNSGR